MSKTYNIAVIPGDGTGPEVVAEGIKVLNAISEKADFKLDLTHYDFGGDRYLRTGEVLPESAVDRENGRGPVSADGRSDWPGRFVPVWL